MIWVVICALGYCLGIVTLPVLFGWLKHEMTDEQTAKVTHNRRTYEKP